MKKFVMLLIATTITVGCWSSSAQAIAPFKKAFQAKYVDPSDNDQLKADFKKASCNTCHVKGKKKTERNAYGDELAELIEGDANKRIKAARKEGTDAGKAEQAVVLEELDAAFGKVAEVPSGEGQPTYGELLESGKLPVPLPTK